MGNYSYSELFSVLVKHNYYLNGISNDISFVIPTVVKSMASGQHQLIKSNATGIAVLYQNEALNTPLIPVDKDLEFYFGLELKESDLFLGISNLNQTTPQAIPWSGDKKFCFFNNGLNAALSYKILDGIVSQNYVLNETIPGNPVNIKLTVKNGLGQEVSVQKDENNVPVNGPYTIINQNTIFNFNCNFIGLGNGFYTLELRDSTNANLLKTLEILVHNELCKTACIGVLYINYPATAAPLPKVNFDMQFNRKSSKWKIFVAMANSDALNLDNKDLVVYDRSGDNTANPAQKTPYNTYQFTGNKAPGADQPDPDPANSVANLDTLVFTSTTEIPFFEVAKTGIALRLIDEVKAPDYLETETPELLIKNIKNPDPRIQGGTESKIYIYI